MMGATSGREIRRYASRQPWFTPSSRAESVRVRESRTTFDEDWVNPTWEAHGRDGLNQPHADDPKGNYGSVAE
jgi:hypothetical protein